MKKPILVIMAAGMGSRYGGLKQIDPIDEDGHIIIDFSLYDAMRAGFNEVAFIIKKDNEEDFKQTIGYRIEKIMKVHYVYQEINDIPLGNIIPKNRIKPWGTAHAIYCCRHIIDGPFAVINADDYYGIEAFKIIYDYLSTHQDNEIYHYAMVGYQIEKTLTENGTVARGVCVVNDEFDLINITERTKIKKTLTGVAYQEDNEWIDLPQDSIVSMNLWGFSQSIIAEIGNGFQSFLDEGLVSHPLKCEYFIPSVVSHLLKQKKATVKVLKTTDQWYGVTYKEDKPKIVEAIQNMKESGLYPKELWGKYNEK